MPICVGLLQSVHVADGYPAVWPDDAAGWLTPGGFLRGWVASRGSTLVGHIAVATVDGEGDPQFALASGRASSQLGEIKRLFVDPAARGAGIARALLNAAVRDVSSRGLHAVLETRADGSVAIRLYERAGWRRIGSSLAAWHGADGERPLLHQFELSL
ncbi:MAG: GNAT family N-acetyltransferase [Vulcanimicrobiaceae bacterium]